MLITKKIKEYKEQNKGFTLLFAILVSMLILSVGMTIINLSLKQIIISTSARESQFAFYAANTGLECAKYWNAENIYINNGKQGYTAEAGKVIFKKDGADLFISTNRDEVMCNGQKLFDISGANLTFDSANRINTFNLKFDPLPYCVYVEVKKEDYTDASGNKKVRTIIDSYGYNVCDVKNPKRIERGLREVIQ